MYKKKSVKSKKPLYASLALICLFVFVSAYALLDGTGLRLSRDDLQLGTVRSGPFKVYLVGNGTIIPRDINYIIPESAAEVLSVNAQSGDFVKEGDTLIVLKNDELQLEFDNSQIALAEAEAALAARSFELETQRLALQQTMLRAKSDYSIQQEEYLANKILFETDNPPISKLKYRQSQIKASELEEVFRLEAIRLKNFEKSMPTQVKQFEEKVRLAENVTTRVAQRVNDLKLRAQRAGVIQDLDIKPGQRVTPGQTLGLVFDPSDIYVTLKVSAVRAHLLSVGQLAEIKASSRSYTGRVTQIDPNVKGTTIDVDITLDSTQNLKSNMFVSGRIIIQALEQALFVEAPSNVVEDAVSSVYVIDEAGNSAERVKVKTGKLSAGLLEIKEGLAPGDKVVISGSDKFNNINKVKLH